MATDDSGNVQGDKEAAPSAAMVSWLPHMTSFCCCMGLEAGAKVVGYLHLVCGLVATVACSVFAGQLRALVDSPDDAEHVYRSTYTVSIVVAVTSSVHVLLGGTLLYGAHKRHRACLRGWVLVMCALYASSLLYVLVTSAVYGLASTGSDIFVTFLEGLLYLCVVGYCILCVNSFYMLVKSSEDMEGPKYNY